MDLIAKSGEIKRCVGCGKSFTCGAGTGACWCMELPPVLPVPSADAAGCYCRECLMARLATMKVDMPNKCSMQNKEVT